MKLTSNRDFYRIENNVYTSGVHRIILHTAYLVRFILPPPRQSDDLRGSIILGYRTRNAGMPTSAYLYMEGSTLGLITDGASSLKSVGNVFQDSHQNEIMVQAFSHQVTVPRDLQFPHSTGQRVHRPLMISKVVDRSSPLIYRALAIKEKMTHCYLTWYRIGENGVEIYYRIDLEDATIVDIQTKMAPCNDSSGDHATIVEDVYFTYQMITWSHIGGNTTESDDLRKLNNG